jgi:hypothetical protein
MSTGGPLCPFDLRVFEIARFLNCELADDPVYDGLELQWFDDPAHGTGLLAFLSRRADRTVDYYCEAGLRLDRDSYALAGGTGSWTETVFAARQLEVHADGVAVDVCFRDVDGRLVEVRVDDRDGRRRRRGTLLAPVGAAVDRPNALLLVLLHGFDLVRAGGRAAGRPLVRIGGREAATGALAGRRLHRHELVKYAAPLCSVELNRNGDGPLGPPAGDVSTVPAADGPGVEGLQVSAAGHDARLVLSPPLPDLEGMDDGAHRTGRWTVTVDAARVTGGTWSATRRGDEVALGLEVRDRWRPGPLPLLMRVVTTLAPVFRRWPTTYRWRATVTLGQVPSMISAWERTTAERGESYRRATQARRG